MTPKQSILMAQTPPLYRGVLERAFAGGSRAAAIKAKCLTCTNFDRSEITHCRVETCPLWVVRPYQGGAE
jgi:hypothetical protein